MEPLQLNASELSIPLLLVDTDFLFLICLFSKSILFFQYLLPFSSNFLIFLADVMQTLNVKQNFFPGDTLIGYFSGVQTTPKPHCFSGRLWKGEFQLFLYGQSTDTRNMAQKQCWASGVTATRTSQQGWKVTPGKAWSQSRDLNECISYQALLIILWL